MADYYPLIARAVAGLDKNTGDARRTLYERARDALVTQLRGTNPPMSESDITKERLALEEAIRRVEADTARRARMEAQGQAAPPPPPPPSHPPQVASEPARTERRAPPPPPSPGPPAPQNKPAASAKPKPTVNAFAPQPQESPAPRGPAPARPPAPERAAASRRPLSDEGLKGFRDVVAEAETLGQATAHASKAAREAYAAVPSDMPDFDRIEPKVEPDGLRMSIREAPVQRNQDAPLRRVEPASRPLGPEPPSEPEYVSPPRMPSRQREAEVVDDNRTRTGLVAALVSVFLVILLGLAVYWQRDRVAAVFNSVKGTSAPAPREAGPSRPKITDRVGQPSQDAAAGVQRGQQNSQQTAAVAQRVVLYEEDPADPAGKRYVGSAIWRMDTVPGAPGQPPELAVRADVEIPERRITMTLTLRRNSDQALPASHTIEIMFNLPADFPFGGVSNVPGILMKQAEQTRGAPLAGLAVKVTSGFFLVGLSAVDSDQQRNLQLLKERSWFDIPVVYNNGRRAILAVEKGNPGDRAFAEAFAAWGQGG